MQDGLFKPDPALMSWLPGETLFSLCSRHHRLWGYATASQSARVLFGGPRTGTRSCLRRFMNLRTPPSVRCARRITQRRMLDAEFTGEPQRARKKKLGIPLAIIGKVFGGNRQLSANSGQVTFRMLPNG